RLLRFRGETVEVQNYIDDTGVQVADVVVGFRELEGRDLDGVRAIADSTRFDYYCWDLYARVTEWYEADHTRLAIRAATLHDIEHGGTEAAAIGRLIADRVVRRHLETMARLNVGYDLLTWEGDIIRLQFWAHAFELLKKQGSVFLQTEGKLAGCWVMRIDEDGDGIDSGRRQTEGAGQGFEAEDQASEPGDQESGGAGQGSEGGGPASVPAGKEEEQGDQREKVIVRSNGTVTYVGKDIAYQFWKFGLLGKDFFYRVFATDTVGRTLWATSAEPPPNGGPRAPAFGHAETTYNVIDTRQSYLQKLLKQALAVMGFTRESERSVHFSYEMVALSHATARELGYAAADPGRPFVEVSGRKGVGVKADDLLDRLTDKAHAEVVKRNADLPPADARQVAEIIAIAAVRYLLLKYSLGKVIAFDIDEALSFEGETGPYLQYAVVRANNIFHKLREREGLDEAGVVAALGNTPDEALAVGEEADAMWGLVLEAARLDEIADAAIRTLELSVVAKYAFGLAQAFNAFYHRFPVLNEDRGDVRRWRAAAVIYFRAQMTRALNLMGCDVPARM
ncbi:MAG: arginine--tRNA ligase, partial [Acidobacteria bacterium]|nr:arginine--tRNA ligase [Acidobacteriota bacterium]